MNAEQLERIALEAPTATAIQEITIDPLQQELAAKARNILEYGLLEETLPTTVAIKKVQQAQILADTLNKLDIKPFNSKQVESYKEQQRRKLDRNSLSSLPIFVQAHVVLDKMLSFMNDLNEGMTALLVFGPWIAGIANIIMLFKQQWITAGILTPFTIFGLCTAYVIMFNDKVEGYNLTKWHWERLSLKQCHTRKIEIPEFVLDTAVRVKEKLPEADLFVDIIVSQNMAIGDPFLGLK